MADTYIDLGSGCSASNLTFESKSFASGFNTDQTHWRLHATLPANSTVTASWSSITCVGNVSSPYYFLENETTRQGAVQFPACGSGSHSFALQFPASQVFGLCLAPGQGQGTITLHDVALSANPCGQPCQYGTEPQPTAALVNRITESLLTSWLQGLPDLSWLLPVFAPLIGYDLITTDLCSRPPPPTPTIDISTLNATATTVLQILSVVAWPHLCRCVAGTPTPNPPAPFAPSEPTGWPPAVVFGCDPADLCGSLVAIQQTLLQMQATLGQGLGLTTLIQRYQLPFASIPGPTHGPLSNQGSFPITRLVGLRVNVTASAPGRPVSPDVPPYLWDLGWMSISDGGPMLQERRVNRGTFDWLPPSMALATSVGYSLTPGTVATIQELLAEP